MLVGLKPKGTTPLVLKSITGHDPDPLPSPILVQWYYRHRTHYGYRCV